MANERKILAATPEDPYVWSPETQLVRRIGSFDVFASDPADLDGKTICYYLRDANGNDVIRIDSYKKGYIASTWELNVSLEAYIEKVDEYLEHFDETLRNADPQAFGVVIISSARGIEEYQFTRPLSIKDFEETDLYKLGQQDTLTLFRFVSPVGDFVSEPMKKKVGFITVIDQESKSRQLDQMTIFAQGTGLSIPSESIKDFFAFIMEKELENPIT